MMAFLLIACLAPDQPQWDGDTLTLSSMWFYYGLEESIDPDDGWHFEEPAAVP